MRTVDLDEEGKALLRKILVGQAYRQMMAANIRGHGLKFLGRPTGRLNLVKDLEHILGQAQRVQELYSTIGGGEVRREAAVKMDRIPYPGSRLELAAFLAAFDSAEAVAMEGYVESKSDEFAEIARVNLEHEYQATVRSQEFFQSFATDRGQHPHAQQMFDRWLVIALLALGRPGTHGDRRAVELGLRSRSCGDSVRVYLERIESFMQACSLEMPDLAAAGVELPG